MLHSRLRIDGWAINVKRTYRVSREEGLMVRKRRRKKLPVPERQPLVRPTQPNEVWSMDFVFDELANACENTDGRGRLQQGVGADRC
jgi:putative transposase